MKKIFFVNLILLVCVNLPAQLKWLNPTPAGWINTKIQFVNESTGYLMNSNGDLFVSKDTGNTWQSHGHFPGAQTFCLRDSVGFIPCYDSTIYMTTDNGATWLRNIGSPGRTLINEWCDIVGKDTFFVLSNAGPFSARLYKSINRGATWQLVNNDVYPLKNSSIDFITSKKGYALKPGAIVKTTDGGVTWQEQYTVTDGSNVITLKYYDTMRAVVYREGSQKITWTTNGGSSWTNSSDQIGGTIYDFFFVDALTIYACGELGIVYKSTNGGVNWTSKGPAPFADYYHLYSQYYFNADNGIVTGFRGRISKTRNGGQTWQNHSPTYVDITGISFDDQTTGYASTWNNIYKTTNSGVTWDSLTFTTVGLGINTRFQHCRFSSPDTGIITTREPVKIYKTVNGGQSWTSFTPTQSFGPYVDVYSMSFPSKDTGFISLRGSVNHLLKTVNGGSSWSEVGSNQDIRLLFFFDSKFGYGTVYDRIYRTADGGLNWTLMPVPPADHPFNAMWFITPAKGFTVGDQGQLKMTNDSGYHWTDIHLDPFELPTYKTIRFYNANIGYMNADYNSYYKTTDGGYTWKKNGNTAYDCSSILFRPDSTVLFAGLNGQIVTRDIAEYDIDSLKVVPSSCSGTFSAKISAYLSPVDSIWFEYGKYGFTNSIAGNPVGVADTSKWITATVNTLEPDSTYHVRVKVRFRGKYYYSPDLVFKPIKTSAPLISAAGNVLSSSIATGNQWYLNGAPIAGATGQQYTAVASGAYTATATQGGCLTGTSAVINLTVTAVPDITAWGQEIQIYPNPAVDDKINVVVSTGRRLTLQITDINGRLIKDQSLSNGTNSITLSQLQSGMYIFIIRDKKTFETVKKKVLKF